MNKNAKNTKNTLAGPVPMLRLADMQSPDRPQDRIHCKPEKPPERVVNMKLPLDLVDAIEVMAEDSHRPFHEVIRAALYWACWAHSHGRSPDIEMVGHHHPGGYKNWDEKIRAKREARELKRLYELGTPSE